MKLSVFMITYNHRAFIAQAIESALTQETDFDFEIVIGEDCSTDGTREIVADYAARYPDRIRAILHPQNVGMHQNAVCSLQACRGEYIAMLEGDDYWIYPKKLQKQVDFLDAHRECSMCFHNVYEEHPDGTRLDMSRRLPQWKPRSTLRDVVVAGAGGIATCSKVFRRSLLPLSDAFYRIPAPTNLLNVIAATKGELAHIDELWGVYRLHGHGVYSSKALVERLQQTVDNLEVIKELVGCEHRKDIRARLAETHYEIASHYFWHDQFREARHHAVESLRNAPMYSNTSKLALCKIILRDAAPFVYRGFTRLKRLVTRPS
jgi:glycosyltransferase involved in cell wall biosynthesis